MQFPRYTFAPSPRVLDPRATTSREAGSMRYPRTAAAGRFAAAPAGLRAGLAGALSILLLGCNEEEPVQPEPTPTGSIELEFHHSVGDSALVMGTSWYTNAVGNQYRVETLRYYISDVAIRAPDAEVKFPIAHLLDAERPETLEIRLDGIPEGHYHEIAFTFGLASEWNQTGRLPANPPNLEMAWPNVLGGGYHYMKLEGEFLDAAQHPTTFRTHIGRLVSGSVVHDHSFRLSFIAHANVVRNEVRHAEILVDLNEWYTNPYDVDLETHVAGIMEDTAAQDLLQANGADVFRLGQVEGGGHEEP